MVGLSSAVRWWEDYQLRVLVLSSTFLQLFLHFATVARKYRIPSWFRVCIWLAYLGSDAVAIYALATLFNRHKEAASRASTLEVLWAPILLVHLGGPVSISAYDMEDNELWKRHILTLLSQVSVALYVFWKSWPRGGERPLLQAAALLFTLGIVRFSVKPWALKRASINNLAISRASMIGRRKRFRLCEVLSSWYATCTSDAVFMDSMERNNAARDEASSAGRRHDDQEGGGGGGGGSGSGNAISLEEYAREARICVVELKGEAAASNDPHRAFDPRSRLLSSPYSRPEPHLLADRSLPYSLRLDALRSFLELDEYQRAYGVLEAGLFRMFDLLYTKQKVLFTALGTLLFYLTLPLSLAAMALFARARKDGYGEVDVVVTYITLCCISLLEASQYCHFGTPTEWLLRSSVVTVAQHSVLSFAARRKKPTKLMMLAAAGGCDDYVNLYWHIEHHLSSLSITTQVLGHLEDGWREYIHDAASFRRFSERRGQWTLGRSRHRRALQGCGGGGLQALRRSLLVPFDESVLLWHIATDLCFHHPHATPFQESATVSREISNYMIYLLLLRPDMLLPGSREDLFGIACDDIEIMLHGEDEPLLLDERRLAQAMVRRARQLSRLFADSLGPPAPKACTLAEALMELGDEEERWKVIEGVWVEMLCYSASRCRGYLHAKSLGEGGEFLSYVWLLSSYMGMETFADRFQKPEPPEEDETAGGAPTSQPQGGR